MAACFYFIEERFMSKASKRMSHVFNGMVVKHGRDIDTAELQFIGGGVSATFFCAQQAHHAAHAINNHDRMADEIAELREALSSMIEHFDKYNGNIENISNLSYSALKSKQLLNK